MFCEVVRISSPNDTGGSLTRDSWNRSYSYLLNSLVYGSSRDISGLFSVGQTICDLVVPVSCLARVLRVRPVDCRADTSLRQESRQHAVRLARGFGGGLIIGLSATGEVFEVVDQSGYVRWASPPATVMSFVLRARLESELASMMARAGE